MAEEKDKNKNFISRLKESLNQHYDIIVYRFHSYEEIWSKKIKKVNIISYAILFLLVYTAFILILIIFTPLNRLLPAYHNSELQQQVVRNAIKADSLEHELKIRDQYIQNIRKVIQGKTPDNAIMNRDSSFNTNNPKPTNPSPKPSGKRQITQTAGMQNSRNTPPKKETISSLNIISPIDGMLVDTFNVTQKHFGVDLVAEPESPIVAVLDGTVISASWTLTTGYVIRIQHKNNLISCYKHNSVLMKEAGDHVNAGEPIAIIGNTGHYTTGPHLHFELWKNGVPRDPKNYINFE